MFRRLALASLALAALTVPTLAITPIDDFEVGPFAFQSVGAYQEHDVVISGWFGHVITPVREVRLEPGTAGTTITTQLSTTFGNDSATTTILGNGRQRFFYDFQTPIDLTDGGVYDRIEVDYTFITPGAYLTMALGGPAGFCSNERYPTANPGVLTWSLPVCQSIPPDAIDLIAVGCVSPGGDAEFRIRSVRLGRSGAYVPQIVRDFIAIEVPPLPSPPFPWTLLDALGQPLYDAALVIESASADGVIPELMIETAAEPFHGGSRVRSSVALVDDGLLPDVVQMELVFTLESTGSGTPAFATVAPPAINGADALVTATIGVSDQRAPVGDSAVRLGLAVPPEQPYVIGAIAAEATSDSQLEVAIALRGGSSYEPDAPLLEIIWETDWREDTVTGVASPAAVGPAARSLVAAPSVTTSSTTLRPSQPFASGATVRIYDVAGRLVRELAPPVGGQALVWDGRDGGGVPASSGTYLARWREPTGEAATARIVRVR
jgi:hypothetical protein